MKASEVRIDIIGAGQVVQGFLKNRNPELDIRVYSRNIQSASLAMARPLDTYQPSDRILILCASTDEESVLKNAGSQARIAVAQENLAIIKRLIQDGTFKNQTVFVLTNPSEIIAEYLYQNTQSKNIYALGLNTDHKRYSEILKQPEFTHLSSKFSVSGNHYDFPYPLFHPPISDIDEDPKIKSLHSALQSRIRNEFQGHRPPIASGITALQDLAQALLLKQSLYVSAFCSELDGFTGGSLDFNTFTFSPSLGNSLASKARIQSVAKTHRESYFRITSNQALKESI